MRATAALSFMQIVAEPAATARDPAPLQLLERHLAGTMLRIPSGTDAILLRPILHVILVSGG